MAYNSPMTKEQIRKINMLARKTGAYEGSEGMVVNGRTYHFELESAKGGWVPRGYASEIIDILLAAPQINEPDSNEPPKPATAKQIAYIEMLAKKAGRTVETKRLTRWKASALIDELKAETASPPERIV